MNADEQHEQTTDSQERCPTPAERIQAGMAARRRREYLFRACGLGAVATSLLVVLLMLTSIVLKGHTAFVQTGILLDVYFDPAVLDVANLERADYEELVALSLHRLFPEVQDPDERRELRGLVSVGAAYRLREMVLRNPALIGERQQLWVEASDVTDMFVKGHLAPETIGVDQRVSERQVRRLAVLEERGLLERRFNTGFFTGSDSREPELAGIHGAVVGSLLTLLVTFAVSFPLGVATALYLNEFVHRNRWVDLVELNIANLASVPPIVFGLLGLAVFLNLLGLPRSSPLVGGLVLSLMTLPTIVIAARVALQAVPQSVRDAALGVGASRMQTIWHHVLPMALPGILTGTILSMVRALGEAAPLLLIGMVAFLADVPRGITDPATVLPVQIFLWADLPEHAFVERTAAAILVLLAMLLVLNTVAIALRRRFGR
ncbi:MAG: phosphate ABC transporter permease PstA [Desulfobulbus sp.]|jgi:phosphate transport system permease protein